MHLKLIRDINESAVSTEGTVLCNGVHECYSLEDKDRFLETGGTKVQNQTCIPRGKYRIIVTYSNRFKRKLPLLLDVPMFTGIRMHTGNSSKDTEGCIIVGASNVVKGDDWVSQSTIAFNKLMLKIETALASGELVTIEIV